MKKLSKLLLVNWLNFSYELMDFGDVNFLTGKNGAGKSTIIDALQLVMLADTQGGSFNKAANQKSDRNLESYLYGDFGYEDSAGPLRGSKGRFTSYVAAQFDDDVTNKSFFTAFVADCYKDKKINRVWLIAEEKLSRGSFLSEKGVPYDIDTLKGLYRGKTANTSHFEFMDTNKAYLARLAYNLGSIRSSYFTLLRKGVPFSFTFTQTPDITRFITESICEIDSYINVEAMQQDIRQYAELEVQATEMEQKISILEEISALSERIEIAKVAKREYEYLIDRAHVEENKRDLATLTSDCKEREEALKAGEKALSELENAINGLEDEIESIRKEIYTSDEHTRKERLEGEIASLNVEITRLTRIFETARNEVAAFLSAWNAVSAEPLFQKISPSIPPLGAFALDGKDYFASLKKGVKALDSIYDSLLSSRSEVRMEKTRLENEIKALKNQIENLKQGIKAFPSAVVQYRTLLEKHGISSSVVADSAEVLDENWRRTLEGMLDRNRFALIVPEESYQRAFNLLLEFEGKENVTLVDLERLPEPQMVKSSLIEEIHSDDEHTQRYLSYLLGPVAKGILPHFPSASEDGSTYQNSSTMRLGSDYASFPFLGQNAIRLAISRLEGELREKERELALHIEYLHFLDNCLSLRRISCDRLTEFEENLSLENHIAELEEKRRSAKVELSSIDMFFFENLERKQKAKEKEKREMETRRSADERTLGSLEAALKNCREVQIPALENEIEKLGGNLLQVYDSALRDRLESRFQKEFASCRSGSLMSNNFNPVLCKTQLEIERLCEERRRKRVTYNTRFLTPFDTSAESNDRFDEELGQLKSIKLPEYLEKIREAKTRAYKQFRGDFIAKMTANIEAVEEQVRILNNALKSAVFGSNRYRFIVSPNKKYENFYKMFKDPMLFSLDQPSLMDDFFNEKYKNEIDTLFTSLMVPASGQRSDYENSVKLFTDYRTYLSFDLEVVDTISSSRERLSRTWKKKSGGETQQPFYLALLASFSQICRVNQQGYNNTVRLIMFDEAFSKMDGDRIKASIELLKKFNLQAIFSAPPEKIPEISPLVDRTIIVFKDEKHSFTKLYRIKDADDGKR